MQIKKYILIFTIFFFSFFGFSKTKNISYKLSKKQGRVVIESSQGERISWAAYSVPGSREMNIFKKMNMPFVKSGVNVYQISTWRKGKHFFSNPFSSIDGKHVLNPREGATYDEQAKLLIKENPNARFIIRFGMQADMQWRKNNLDQYQQMSKATFFNDSYSVNPSLASEKGLANIKMMIEDTVAWCEKQTWRNRIFAYFMLPYGEGTTEIGVYGRYFDESKPMQKKFKQFLKKKYKTNKKLQKAWNDNFITFNKVKVPKDKEWLEKKKKENIQHWPNPLKIAKEKDYFLLQKQVYHHFWNEVFDAMKKATKKRPVLKGYDIFKQHQQGWTLIPSFDGSWKSDTLDTYSNPILVTGALGVAPLLEHNGFDFLTTPGMYYNRAMGYASEAEGLTDSLTLLSKVNYMEADMRTWIMRDWNGKSRTSQLMLDFGTALNIKEVNAAFDRQLAWALSRNQMYYYCSVAACNWWFHTDGIQKIIARERKIIKSSVNWETKETLDAICIIIDDDSALYEDFSAGFQNIAVYKQIEEGLALSGIPYRVYLLSDLKRDNFPDYKTYLFPNLFKVDDEVMALLKKKIFKNGHVAIFGPGTGITDGNKISAKSAERIFNVPMQIVNKSVPRRVMLQDHGHPFSKGLKTMTYGSDYAFGPLLTPKNNRYNIGKNASALGNTFYYYFFDKAGLFIKDFGLGGTLSGKKGKRGVGDYSIIFSPAIPVPPELLRAAAKYAGSCVWSENNNVIYANNSFVGMHTVISGKQRINLPGKFDVIDINTGKLIAKNTNYIDVVTKSPETVLFRLRKND